MFILSFAPVYFQELSAPCLIILPDVGIGPVKEFLVGVQFVLEQRLAEFFLDQAFALARVLPIGKTDLLNDFVDVK